MEQTDSRHDQPIRGWAVLGPAIPGVVALVLLMAHTLANALLRTAFSAPLEGTLEVAAFWYMPAIALLGAVVALRRDEHISADLLYRRAPSRVQREYRILGLLLLLVMSVGFTWFGLLEAMKNAEIGRTAGTSDVPIWPPEFLVPVAFGAIVLQIVFDLVRLVRKGATVPAAGGPEGIGDE